MEREHVESSNIESIGYDWKTRTLEVEFKGGKVYQYKSFPKRTHKALMEAESKGKFFNEFIKEKFETTKL